MINRFKLYKSGKQWVIAGILAVFMIISLTGFSQKSVFADTGSSQPKLNQTVTTTNPEVQTTFNYTYQSKTYSEPITIPAGTTNISVTVGSNRYGYAKVMNYKGTTTAEIASKLSIQEDLDRSVDDVSVSAQGSFGNTILYQKNLDTLITSDTTSFYANQFDSTGKYFETSLQVTIPSDVSEMTIQGLKIDGTYSTLLDSKGSLIQLESQLDQFKYNYNYDVNNGVKPFFKNYGLKVTFVAASGTETSFSTASTLPTVTNSIVDKEASVRTEKPVIKEPIETTVKTAPLARQKTTITVDKHTTVPAGSLKQANIDSNSHVNTAPKSVIQQAIKSEETPIKDKKVSESPTVKKASTKTKPLTKKSIRNAGLENDPTLLLESLAGLSIGSTLFFGKPKQRQK